jgi:2-polyprenyl-3-methyl-5-hydroxy-6-metoxy-1,4-benzoquinol methylase
MLRGIARGLLWPVRRFFDPRFAGVAEQARATHEVLTNRVEQADDQYRAAEKHADGRHRESMFAHQQTRSDIDQLHWLLRADMDATSEGVTLIGRSLRDVEDMVEASGRSLRDVEAMVEKAWYGSRSYVEEIADGSIEQIEHDVAHLLNYANSHDGFAAQRGVWFNPPVLVQYKPGDAFIGHVNERIAEVPFVFQAIARIPRGAEILDVGASESTLCLSLATFGYRVTAIDPRPNPLSHPNLRVVVGKIEEQEELGTFQATVCLSTIEHIGLGAYEQEGDATRADLAAMRRIRELTEPGGLLILTTSYGRSREDEFSRTYDRRGLDELLEGWNLEELSFLVRRDETTWISLDSTEPPIGEDREVVAMLTATRGP